MTFHTPDDDSGNSLAWLASFVAFGFVMFFVGYAVALKVNQL
jgi:hypothetical protein